MKIILGMVGAVTLIVCVALALFFFLVGVIDEREGGDLR